ncbi:FkbM family methyltransferase [Actinotalea subterranea]|uniref:FkbM family methyltransferase n=1 Tax=Actinotalea subterranea TaxID=2607497 RepID=UPI0011ED924B|nr:FkbM family methyltransferase [Actinotalea subterranea]
MPAPHQRPEPRTDHLEPAAADRVRMTVSCRDSDRLPKVPGAGEVFDHDGTSVQRMHNGLLIEEGCYFGPWMTEIIRALEGNHEPQEEVVFHEVLERLLATDPDAAMIELGSFWAYYTMWFLQRSGGNRAVCLEPDPAYLATGRRNLALNGLEATFLHGAVGSEPGLPTSFVAESTGEAVEVRQYDLESLMAETGLDRVGLIMVDIQGFETVLLERALPLLRSGAVRFAIVSTHHHQISGEAVTHQKVLGLLRDCGAHVIAEHTVAESYSGDGLIAVSFDERDADLRVDVSHARAKDSLFGELEPDLQRAMDEAAAQRAAADAAQAELAAARAELAATLRSTSWRVSAPVRAAGRLVHRLRGRGA